ncbi:MAG: transporter permease [Thermomicrobiales bacterium]|jgi:peptide/nickel transport system permease protein|nr:transporter permease [Thermomicrobiales bacterium]MCD6058829.1 transporter permease [Thermomicrobiales bacterium]
MARATEAFEAADIATAPATALTTVRQQSSGFRLLRRLRSERKAIAGLIIIALLALVAIFGPALAPHHPDADDFGILQAPSVEHPMGTDSFGRDLLSRLIIGTRVSFSVGFLAAVVALSIGGALGLLAGYYGRWVDSVISRAVDLLWAFPVIILAVALVAIFGAGFRNVVIAIAVAYVDDFARIVRGETLSLREQDFTMAARALGARDDEVMVRHIVPNLIAPLTVQLSFAVGLGILTESTLTFLGLGVNPATPTWGLAINEGRDFVRQAWWISVFPGLAIVITVMALNLLGDGLRDALDVRGVSDV